MLTGKFRKVRAPAACRAADLVRVIDYRGLVATFGAHMGDITETECRVGISLGEPQGGNTRDGKA